MLEKVKLTLGLTTDAFDDDIQANIEAAQAELIRAGVSEAVATSDTPLITKAIKTFCQKEFSEGSEAERFENSWLCQLDNLRKSTGYRDEK